MKAIAAALVFFTRLPFWRLKAFNVPTEYFKNVINYWAIVGWLTASIMAATLWLSAQVLPYSIAIIIAILSRLLITGALHEDGLADFMDGMGGGTTKERILAIMKDSHIGTYGVLGLIIYFLLLHATLSELNSSLAIAVIFAGDPLCKFIASQITIPLPYARTEESSKAKVVYNRISAPQYILSLFAGLLPIAALLNYHLWPAILFPIATFILLVLIMKRKIQGYTGDCCGATFLLCELSFYLGVLILVHLF